MKKMPTLFERVFENYNKKECLNKVNPLCEWVIDGEGYATEKLDGTCCLIMNNEIYRRFDYKVGRKLPIGAIPCQDKADEVTGHFPHWVKCDKNNPNDKYHILALKKNTEWEEGTYELIGPHIGGNPYDLSEDILEKHGKRILRDVPRDYDGIREYLKNHYIEGIVFYRGNGDMCKIKRSYFGYNWKSKNNC